MECIKSYLACLRLLNYREEILKFLHTETYINSLLHPLMGFFNLHSAYLCLIIFSETFLLP